RIEVDWYTERLSGFVEYIEAHSYFSRAPGQEAVKGHSERVLETVDQLLGVFLQSAVILTDPVQLRPPHQGRGGYRTTIWSNAADEPCAFAGIEDCAIEALRNPVLQPGTPCDLPLLRGDHAKLSGLTE